MKICLLNWEGQACRNEPPPDVCHQQLRHAEESKEAKSKAEFKRSSVLLDCSSKLQVTARLVSSITTKVYARGTASDPPKRKERKLRTQRKVFLCRLRKRRHIQSKLAQKGCKSPPPQSSLPEEQKGLVRIMSVPGSAQLQNLALRALWFQVSGHTLQNLHGGSMRACYEKKGHIAHVKHADTSLDNPKTPAWLLGGGQGFDLDLRGLLAVAVPLPIVDLVFIVFDFNQVHMLLVCTQLMRFNKFN
eukprot:1140712-Pelagomonas_calceolata.AAC.1